MAKKTQARMSIDLHGVQHQHVERKLEDALLLNQCYPVHIITGDSPKMRSLVTRFLRYYKFRYSIGDFQNKGYVIVEG